METAINSGNELESRVSSLIRKVESDPEQWYKLLIEKIIRQELQIEELTRRLVDLEKYEQFNSAIIESSLLDTPAFFSESFDIRASHNLLPDEGFYNKEESAAGFSFRWTKQNFYFELPIKRNTPKTVQLFLASAIKPELLNEIKCYANGSPIALHKLSSDHDHIYEGTLEAAKTHSITRISFHTRTSYTPKEFNPESSDNRQLAVTFKQLTVN